MSSVGPLLQADSPDILPRPDLPKPIEFYWLRGYPLPLQELHPHELASFRYSMVQAMRHRKMAILLRDHQDPDMQYWYPWWAGMAENAYRDARHTRDFGGYGHTCYEQ